MITLAPQLPAAEAPRTSPQLHTSQPSSARNTSTDTEREGRSERSSKKPSSGRDRSGAPSRAGRADQARESDVSTNKSSGAVPASSKPYLSRTVTSNVSSGDETEPANQQLFHAAWSHALSEDDTNGIAPHISNLAGADQQAARTPKTRFNTNAVNVSVAQTASEPPPFSFAVPVAASAASKALSIKAGEANPATAPAIDGESDSEAEAPAPSTDPIAFTARIHNSAEPASGPPNVKSQNVVAEPQAVSAAETPSADASAAKELAQEIEPAGAHTEFAVGNTAAPAHLAPVQPIETPQIAPLSAAPVKDLALHLGGPQNVEVRVSEQFGQIKVDVRTADPTLAQDLRGGLHDLVSKLDSKGFTTAVSAPSEGTISSARTSDSELSQDQNSGGQHSNAQQDEQQKQRQLQNQEAWSRRNHGAWLDTLSTNIEELT